ncbi:MAG: class I SAM-dependent methyltransferase [Ferruginibacter sp.]
MKEELNYIEKNKASWNDKTDHHFRSEFYDVDGFLKGKSSLNEIELKLLGDVSGKTILHLQCHFGMDSISLGRMGGIVTGVDLSDKAIMKANELAKQTNINANFTCCDIYDLPAYLDKTFDIVFSSYGTIGWLPDIDKWAAIVSKYLRPGGKFIFAEFHPVIWMFDEDFEKIRYKYEKSEPIIETITGTYAEKDAPIISETVSWNHSISEVLNALIKQGLEINVFNEYDHSPYNCFNKTEEFEPGKFRIKHFENKIPMVYAIVATKKYR